MTSAEPVPDPAQLRRAFLARIARLVLSEDGCLDGRAAQVLHRHGIITLEGADEPPPDVDAIRAGAALQPAEVPAGPLVFFRDRKGTPAVVHVRALVLDRALAHRSAAADHLERLAAIPRVCSTSTAELFRRESGSLRSPDPGVWTAAAASLADALESDWLLQLTGLRQSRFHRNRTLRDQFIGAALRPSVQAVLACKPSLLLPHRVRAATLEHTARLQDPSLPLAEVLDSYADACGHLSLGGDLSLGALLSSRGETGPDTWATLWSWATSKGTVLAEFHVCHAGLVVPCLIPAEARAVVGGVFWRAVLNHAGAGGVQEQPPSWRLVHLLAACMTRYLELRLPMDDGDWVAAMSWWFAARLAAELAGSEEEVRAHADALWEHVGEIDSALWELAGPPMQLSTLRFLTLRGPSPLAMSLAAAASSAQQMGWLLASEGPGSRRERLAALGALGTIARLIPLGDPVNEYAFGPGVGAAIEAAASCESDPEVQAGLRACNEQTRWSEPDPIGDLLRGIQGQDVQAQRYLAAVLRTRAQVGEVDIEALWRVLSGDLWTTEIWSALDPVAAEWIATALIDLAALRWPEWAPRVPHLLAMIAEQLAADESRQRSMFAMVVRASCALRVGSALWRLRRGPQSHRFQPFATALSASYQRLLPRAGWWAEGHIRATLTDLTA